MIQAIETKYKGYRFRSRLEARWAVFFEQLFPGQWQYEKAGYVLGNGECYLPDFWLPLLPQTDEFGTHVEIKPVEPTVEEQTKLFWLCEGTKQMSICFYGLPSCDLFSYVYYYDFKNNTVRTVARASTWLNDQLILASTLPHGGPYMVIGVPFNYQFSLFPEDSKKNAIKHAANRAKSARFELGEEG